MKYAIFSLDHLFLFIGSDRGFNVCMTVEVKEIVDERSHFEELLTNPGKRINLVVGCNQ